LTPSLQAGVTAIGWRAKAEAELARTGGSITRAGVMAQISYLYFVEAGLRSESPHILPDPPAA
jgi:hypothetical protein